MIQVSRNVNTETSKFSLFDSFEFVCISISKKLRFSLSRQGANLVTEDHNYCEEQQDTPDHSTCWETEWEG